MTTGGNRPEQQDTLYETTPDHVVDAVKADITDEPLDVRAMTTKEFYKLGLAIVAGLIVALLGALVYLNTSGQTEEAKWNCVPYHTHPERVEIPPEPEETEKRQEGNWSNATDI